MIEVDIQGLGSAGEGVGRLPDGRVVFVPQALPGDRVRIELGVTRKHVQYGELKELLVPSPDRVESPCTVEPCGGCALKKLSRAAQAQLMRLRVVDNLRRLGGLDLEARVGPPVQAGDGWRYRHRVRLHAAWLDGGWRLGYFARRSHRLVPLASCPVLWPELHERAQALVQGLAKLPDAARLDTVELAYSRRDGRAAAALHGVGPIAAYRESLDWLAGTGLSGVEITSGRARWRHGNLELRYDHARAAEFDLLYEPAVFTQAFPEMNDKLVESVMQAVRPQQAPRLLELHAGIGNFTVPLARAGARGIAVEHHRRATILCQRNARAAGVDIEVRDISDHQALDLVLGSDVVLLDPPRTGARAVAEALATGGPPRVVYVSCDSATLARDAAILVRGGYTLTAVELFDMFPQTEHAETLAIFDR